MHAHVDKVYLSVRRVCTHTDADWQDNKIESQRKMSATRFSVADVPLVPQLLPKGSDLSGAGSVLAVLATPEVLEAAAVLAFLGGMVLWALNMSRMIFGAFLSKTARDDEG